jgi:glycosyltransferase involved in cell wall biosynthesis
MRPIRDLIDDVLLTRMLRSLRPDAVFCYFVKPAIYGTLAARFAGVPNRYAMVAGLGYVFTDSGDKKRVRRWALRRVLLTLFNVAFRFCDRVFFQNPDDVAVFTDRRLIDPAKAFRVNGTGVDLRLFNTAPPTTRPVTFLLMARLLREKGVFEYVDAARTVKKQAPATRFILLGAVDPNPGSLREEQVTAWAREGTIEWPGHVDDVQPWLAQASVYVLPSYREGLPRSTLEAMAMARPIITTDAIGCRETVRDGVNGFLIPVKDADALAAAMLRFVRDPELIPAMGRASRLLAEERFDAHSIATQMVEEMA